MSLVNSEYPIDEHFNYQDYLKNADIPTNYENYVKEIATNFYNENKKITLSNDSVIFLFSHLIIFILWDNTNSPFNFKFNSFFRT